MDELLRFGLAERFSVTDEFAHVLPVAFLIMGFLFLALVALGALAKGKRRGPFIEGEVGLSKEHIEGKDVMVRTYVFLQGDLLDALNDRGRQQGVSFRKVIRQELRKALHLPEVKDEFNDEDDT